MTNKEIEKAIGKTTVDGFTFNVENEEQFKIVE